MTNQQGAPEALRLRHYVERRKRAKQLDVNKVHAFDAGCGSEAELLLSDIETLLSLVEAQQPATHVQNPAEIERVAGDVSKNGPESNMAQQAAPSAAAAAPDGWESVIHDIRSGLVDSEPSGYDNSGYRSFAGTVLDAVEDGLLKLAAPQPSPTPQTDSQPAHQRGTGYPPLPATYYLAGGVVRTWDEGQMRAYVDAYRTARAPADSVPVARFDDPKVQAAYAILCSDVQPPEGEHWEGFAARRIVDALSADSVLEDAAASEVLMEHSGCGSGTQVDMLTVRLNPGDKVIMLKGRITQAIDAARKQGGRDAG